MGRLRSVMALLAAVALSGLGTGCAGGGFWKSKPAPYPSEFTSLSPGGGTARPEASAVVPAGGTSPLASLPSSLSWLAGKSDKAPKGGAVTIVPAFQNHIDYLPDPTRNGASGPGLAGQIFAFTAAEQHATLDGSLIVDLYDETKRADGQRPNLPERWKFNKDVLRTLRSVDERFGPNYVIFLPWRAYRPDITRVRITVRYEPENGPYPVIAPETRLTLDPTLAGAGETGARQQSHTISTQTMSPSPPGGSAAVGNATGAAAAPAGSGPGFGVIQMKRPNSQPAMSDAQPPSEFPLSPGLTPPRR